MKYLFTFLFSIVVLFAQTQDNDAQESLKEIRQEYKTLSTVISDCESQGDCNLYANELIINKGGSRWRGVGNYRKTVRFWYSDDPSNCDECKGTLRFVDVRTLSGEGTVHEEYVFKDGELIFHFIKDVRPGSEKKVRSYFDSEWLFRLQVGEEEFYYQEAINQADKGVLDRAKTLQQLFLQSFN